jgi:DNA repair protein RadC
MSDIIDPVKTNEASAENVTPKNIHAGHRKRLRERYARSGMDDFADHEILELMLTYAIPRVDVNDRAHRLIERFGSVAGVLDALPEELCEVDGISDGAAQFLTMLPSLFRRYALDKCEPGKPLDTLAKMGDYLHALYTGITFERVYLLLFDNSMRLIDCCHLDDGAVNCSKVTIRKVAELSLRKHASCAVLAHNHPMGLAIPSGADMEVTRNVDSALEIIGVPLLEHIIVTENSYAPILRHNKGILRASPITGMIDKAFYERFYGEELR